MQLGQENPSSPHLPSRSLLLHRLAQFLLALLLEILLLGLGVQRVELLLALGLPDLLSLRGPLLGLLVLVGLLDLLDVILADQLQLARDFGPEVRRLDERVRDTHEVLEDGHQGLVVVVGR